MSESRVLRYTAKLLANLNGIKKRVDSIRRLTGPDRERETVRLYRYFKIGN
jgi:hypothetical protein